VSGKIVFYEFFIYFIKGVIIFSFFTGNIQYFRSIEKNNIMLKITPQRLRRWKLIITAVLMEKRIIRDIIEWDIENWKYALTFWEREAGDISGARVLDIGARKGGLSLYCALKGCTVICSDVNTPEQTAKPLHIRYNVSHRIEYAAVDALNIPFSDSEFDIVIFKSVLGGVGRDNHPERQYAAVGEMHRVLKPGGKLLFAENLRGSLLHQYLRGWFVRWGASWRYLSVDELHNLFALFSSLSVRCYGFFGAFGRTEFQRRLLHIPDALLNPVLPDRWKYILFGCAVK